MNEQNKFYMKVDDTNNCEDNNENTYYKKIILFLRTIFKLLLAFIMYKFPSGIFFGLPIISTAFNTQPNLTQ